MSSKLNQFIKLKRFAKTAKRDWEFALGQNTYRNFALQLVILFAIIILGYWLASNVAANLRTAGIASGFDFLNQRAGFPLGISFITYDSDSSFYIALLAGLVNSLVIAVMSIIAATCLGVLIGIGRLSHNWLVRSLCLIYVEIFRNLPPILVILFCYFGIFQEFLPSVANSLILPFNIYINQRGFYFPWPIITGNLSAPFIALICGLVVCFFYRRYRRALWHKTGNYVIAWPLYSCMLLVIPLTILLIFTRIVGFDVPQPSRFNITGGVSLRPEMLALFSALSFYSAALISETIRGALIGVDSGILQAAQSLGLRNGLILRLITLPLALRIIIPPLASQYMNIIKNTSLAIAIGYQDFMSIGNSIIEKTNQSVEVVAIWLIVYLGLSLLVSCLMNWFNHKMALKGY